MDEFYEIFGNCRPCNKKLSIRFIDHLDVDPDSKSLFLLAICKIVLLYNYSLKYVSSTITPVILVTSFVSILRYSLML